jgi:hypothetical protein
MPATYEPIATTTLGSAATSITFSGIASSWTDIKVILTLNPATGTRPYLQFNSDSGSNYSRTYLYGDGSAASSGNNTSMTSLSASVADASVPSLWTYDLFSYAGSTKKTILSSVSLDSNGSGYVIRGVHLWNSTSAINNIYIFSTVSNSFAAGTTATLYGIKAA